MGQSDYNWPTLDEFSLFVDYAKLSIVLLTSYREEES